MECDHIRNPPAPRSHHGQDRHRGMYALAVDEVIITVLYQPVNAGREIVVTVARVGAAAQDRESFGFFPDGKSPGTVGREHREIEITTLSQSPGDLIGVSLDPADVREETRGDHEHSQHELFRLAARRLADGPRPVADGSGGKTQYDDGRACSSPDVTGEAVSQSPPHPGREYPRGVVTLRAQRAGPADAPGDFGLGKAFRPAPPHEVAQRLSLPRDVMLHLG